MDFGFFFAQGGIASAPNALYNAASRGFHDELRERLERLEQESGFTNGWKAVHVGKLR